MAAKQESTTSTLEASIAACQESTSNAIAASQESLGSRLETTNAAMADIATKQESTTAAIESKLAASQESMGSAIEALAAKQESTKTEILSAVQGEVSAVRDEVAAVKTEVKEKFDVFEERLRVLETRGPDRDAPSFNMATPPAVPVTVPVLASRGSIKISTYDGKTSWSVFKTQFGMVSTANGWTDIDKAFHLAASLRGEAADILQTIPEERRTNIEALISALDMRFGEQHLQDYYRLQLRTRQQTANETLQELAADIERLCQVAYSNCPTDVRDNLSLQYFTDALRDPELQKALRLAEAKDLKSGLVYAMKIEAAQQATRRDRRPVRGATVEEAVSEEFKELKRAVETLCHNINNVKTTCFHCNQEGQEPKRQVENFRRKPNPSRNRGSNSDGIVCYNCHQEGHFQRSCPEKRKGGHNTGSRNANQLN